MKRSQYMFNTPNTAAGFGRAAAVLVKEARLSRAQQAAIGGGLGLAGGGLAGYLFGGGEDEETGEKKNRLLAALTGAGLGGAVGAGAGAAIPPAWLSSVLGIDRPEIKHLTDPQPGDPHYYEPEPVENSNARSEVQPSTSYRPGLDPIAYHRGGDHIDWQQEGDYMFRQYRSGKPGYPEFPEGIKKLHPSMVDLPEKKEWVGLPWDRYEFGVSPFAPSSQVRLEK